MMRSTPAVHEQAPHTNASASLLADVARAGEIIAPNWPLTNFVAVNPLGGLQHLPFEQAAAEARRWLGAQTHLSLDEHRARYARGLVSDADLRRAIVEVVPDVLDASAAAPRGQAAGDPIDPIEVIRLDLLAGPEDSSPTRPTLGRVDADPAAGVEDRVAAWCAAYVDPHAPWPMPDRDQGFYLAWRGLVQQDRSIRQLATTAGGTLIDALPDRPLSALAAALEHLEVEPTAHRDALRVLLGRLPGWAGYARWCDDWAGEPRRSAHLGLVELLAALACTTAAVARPHELASHELAPHDPPPGHDGPDLHLDGRPPNDRAELLEARVDAVLDALGPTGNRDALSAWSVRQALRAVPTGMRPAIWLEAQEGNLRDRLLGLLTRLDPGPATGRPQVQVACCIDVRSEGLRRHLEALGPIETLGYAGFFGVPMHWRSLGSPDTEARCPVLVTPRHEVVETGVEAGAGRQTAGGQQTGSQNGAAAAAADRAGADTAEQAAAKTADRAGADTAEQAAAKTADRATARYLAARRAAAANHDSFHAAKGDPLAPFALAEAAGWVLGPLAAARTFAPDLTHRLAARLRGLTPPPRTVAQVRADAATNTGLALEERALFAEAIVTTLGATRFAPLVVLCGHGSVTVNNPHASAYDCGACGGAPGGDSARTAAAILNDPAVRTQLAERGRPIPPDTWFVAAQHDTVTDDVRILDLDLVPTTHRPTLEQFAQHTARAGKALAEERARRLPGARRTVRSRGRDWAQVRPEWGLAGNAAFVVGPRSITAELDLASRVFLHSYDAEADVDGGVLETILTAPLVVAQWINAQYYFSSVDPIAFGAGDKLLHNPVADVGVVLGHGGDLQVGLPEQAVGIGARRAHEPVRLLAVVQAPLERTEEIIQRNQVLRELVGGRWVAVAGRSSGDEPWSLRSPKGTWATWAPADAGADPAHGRLEVR